MLDSASTPLGASKLEEDLLLVFEVSLFGHIKLVIYCIRLYVNENVKGNKRTVYGNIVVTFA